MDAGALKPPLVCLITDGSLTPDAAWEPMVDGLRQAAQAGVDFIQIRERHLDDRRLLAFARATVEATAGTPARIVLNDRLDVALAAGAAGVHLRANSYGAADARSLAGPEFLIGRSVHFVGDAVAAEEGGGCDYLVFGTVFPSASKAAGHPVAGIEALAAVCRAVRLPVLAIGGVTVERAPAIAAAGAAGFAAISLFAGSGPVDNIVQHMRHAWS